MQTVANILLIEDEIEIADFIAELLKTQGYLCQICENFDQLSVLAAATAPDLILIDVMLSYQSGFEIATRLQASCHTRDVPFIFLTARSDISSLLLGFELGAVDYIVKPFKPAELIARVNVAVRQKLEIDRLRSQNNELLHQNVTDILTGLKNRRYLQDTIEHLVQQANRYKTEVAFIVIDIDHFKQVNDRWGHGVGDQVLVELAKLMRQSTRRADIVGRYGGEEFLIICPNTSLQSGCNLAERIRTKVETTEFIIRDDLVLHVTISAGVSVFVHKQTGNFSSSTLPDLADEALYAAKQAGRNRTFVHWGCVGGIHQAVSTSLSGEPQQTALV